MRTENANALWTSSSEGADSSQDVRRVVSMGGLRRHSLPSSPYWRLQRVA